MTKKHTIVIADDHEVVRSGVRSYLETTPDFEVLGEASSGEETVELVAEMIVHHKLTLKLIGDKPFEEMDITQQGGMILNLLHQYDQLSLTGRISGEIIELLRKERDFPEVLYQAIQSIDEAIGDLKTRYCQLDELAGGMILEEDVLDCESRVLLRRGVNLSQTIIEALKFQQTRLAKKTFVVKTEIPD